MPSPDGHGWKIDDDRRLSIVWIIWPPAPDDVLELVFRRCKKLACQKGNCNCLNFKLACTDLCDCGDNCKNGKIHDSSENDSEDESCDNDDYDGENWENYKKLLLFVYIL